MQVSSGLQQVTHVEFIKGSKAGGNVLKVLIPRSGNPLDVFITGNLAFLREQAGLQKNQIIYEAGFMQFMSFLTPACKYYFFPAA